MTPLLKLHIDTMQSPKYRSNIGDTGFFLGSSLNDNEKYSTVAQGTYGDMMTDGVSAIEAFCSTLHVGQIRLRWPKPPHVINMTN